MARRDATLFLFFLCAGACAAQGEYNASALSTQLDTLLAEYEREAAPGAPVRVTAALDVRHAAVLEHQSAMRLLAELKLSWRDPRIGWNVTEWGTDHALTAAERLWLPDVVLLNAAATSDVGDDALRARLSAAGDVSWVSRIDVTAPFSMALHDWPKDVQSCTFKFGSRMLNDEELVLELNDLKHAIVFESGTWEVVSIKSKSQTWLRGEERVGVAAWTVRVARRASAHAAAATTTLLAAALMLLAAVALPPTQRHPLAACASFTAAFWLVGAVARLPAAASCPLAVSLMCGMCACGALLAASAALVLRVARCSAPPPQRLRTLLSTLSSVCSLMPTPAGPSAARGAGAWAAAALLLDRALRAALLFVLLVLVVLQLVS